MNKGSILIYGGNSKSRQKKLAQIIEQLDPDLQKVDHPDRLVISPAENKKGIGINQIRALIVFMSTKPYSSRSKLALISPAEQMTPQSQNALLKILEEPPFYATIILSAKSEQSLLSTLISRCRIIRTNSEKESSSDEDTSLRPFTSVLAATIGERLTMAENLAKEEETHIIDQLEYWIKEERYEMTQNHMFDKYKNIELLMEVLRDVEGTNVNTRLALENLFFKL